MDLVEVEKRNSDVINRHPWELARLKVVATILQKTIKNEPGFTVLDIGCGDIFFITQLNDLYPEVSFFAIDTAFTDTIIQKLSTQINGRKISLFKSMDEARLLLNKPADLILLLDVVEHIKDDYQFLKDLSNNPLVDSKTNIMITVPAYQSLFCSHDFFLGHYRRYTNKTLLRVVNNSGFVKLRLGYFFSFLLLPRLIQVMKEKIIKPKLEENTTGLAEWNGNKTVSNLLKNVLLFDYKISSTIKSLTGINLMGLSNYILCKKPA